MVQTKQWGEVLKEEGFQAPRGYVKVSTLLLSLTWGDEPVYETTAVGPGVPHEVAHRPFESRTYKDAIGQHERLVQRLKAGL